MFTLLLMLAWAWADAPDCIDCCKQSGLAGCPTSIRTVGTFTKVHREGGGWRTNGLWIHDCSGAVSFDDGATTVLAKQPRAGEIVRLASPPATINCFRQHCAVPQTGCIVQGDTHGSFFLVNCDSGAALSDTEIQVAGALPVVNHTPTGPDLSLPPPPTRCATDSSFVEEAQRQSYAADAKAAGADADGAAIQYRTALTIDPCNGSAWAGLGQLNLNAKQYAPASRALETAVRLLKDHADAWASLGVAHVGLGQKIEAADAFRQALALHPEHPVAHPGLNEIQSSP